MPPPNRRTNPRHPVMAKGWIAVPPGDSWDPINTVDVSQGGFAFTHPEKIAIDCICQFRLQLPNDAGLMNVEGRITHCLAQADVGAYQVGVQTLTVDVIDMEAIRGGGHGMPQPDPQRDLVFTRTIELPRKLVWAAWTTPAILKKWYAPAPWAMVDCQIDLRPGGIFRTVMHSPDGQQVANRGTYLDIVENEKLVWTNALAPGWRPLGVSADAEDCNEFQYTAVITLEAHGKGTQYTALVIHRDEEGRMKHEAMGFHQGWGAALDQLVATVKAMKTAA